MCTPKREKAVLSICVCWLADTDRDKMRCRYAGRNSADAVDALRWIARVVCSNKYLEGQ